uniref:esterase-like activity of phytase family protein n=1 Tax=Phenylobacterium sp. TaxID=1871053 RepID=UPI0039839546
MRTAGLALALLLAACAQASAPLPAQPVAAGSAITIQAAPVGEVREGWTMLQFGKPDGFTFAGGLHLTSPDTSRLHGLSALEVTADGALTAVSDQGDLVQARIILDETGRLTGVRDGRLTPLRDTEGRPLEGKSESDAEGMATLASGDRLVSFERHHRIWLYPKDGGPPRPAPAPDVKLPDNGGFEALAADPARGRDAYVVGAEESGQTWRCRLSKGCIPGRTVEKFKGMGLTAAASLPQDRTAWLLRGVAGLGLEVVLRIDDAAGRTIAAHRMGENFTVDNFEGLAARPRPDGTIRFYILSDDNFSASQR